MNLSELNSFKLTDVLYFHEELNQAIFDGEMLNPEVRQQLLLIAEDFIEHLGISNLQVQDITLSGSNAAYSYTRHSDIDLHIVVDMNQFNNDDVYRELFSAKKVIYNENHDIKIHDYEVELYVQDTNEPVISLGEYSVLNDKWIRLPRKRKANLDQSATKLKYEKILKLAEFALKSRDDSKIMNVLKILRKYRQAGLDLNGEFGPENLAYKALRKNGIIQKLYDKLDDLHSVNLSLPESKQLDKPDMTVAQLARKHRVPTSHIKAQLEKGVQVEKEHTSSQSLAKEIALNHLEEDPNYYTKLSKAGLEEGASGYIPSNKEKNDPRFKTALTVDIKPDTMKKNAEKFGFKISRAGIPPLLRK